MSLFELKFTWKIIDKQQKDIAECYVKKDKPIQLGSGWVLVNWN